jgi:TM2 domain-containing membrane protein YozV
MKNKLAAGLLGIFLGAFGAHHFYLGNTARGLIYFLLFWTIIIPIIGLVEGIMIITMTDEEFDNKYNNGVRYNNSFNNVRPNIPSELRELHRLKEEGIITPAEFEEQKRKLLNAN